jgi:protein SCO1/2
MTRPVVAVTGVVVALMLASCAPAPHELSGFIRTPAPEVSTVSLPDVSSGGDEFRFSAPSGGILLVYFGYTSCPDVCPTTLADVRKALGELGSDADRVSLAMATVDPVRDTDQVLTSYVQTFVPGSHALRTEDDDALRAAASVFGADYDVSSVGGDVEVVHTGSLYAVDDTGVLRVTWPFGTRWEDLAADLELLLGSV